MVGMEYMREDVMLGEVVKEVGGEKVEGVMKEKDWLFDVVRGNGLI